MSHFLRCTMTYRYFSVQLETLSRFGYSAEHALNILDLSLSELKHPSKRLSIEGIESVYQDAATRLSDPLIALRVGYDFRVPNFTQTGTLYGYCRDLSEVMDMNRKYQKLAVDAADISHDIEDGRHFFTLTPYENEAATPHVLLMIMGAYASSFQWLTWTTGREIKAAYFNRPAPKDTSLFEEIFRCPVYFDQDRSRLEFYAESINVPLTTANPEKLAAVIFKLESLLQSQNASESFAEAVRSSTRTALKMGAVSLAIVAKRLDMSERQLRQKLKHINETFRDILETERKDAFERLYKRGESFATIAQSLGYNDQSAFNRAFKRWYGMSPTDYRRQRDEISD